VVNEHSLYVTKVTPLLLVATDELVFEELDVGFHFVGLQNDGIVDSTLALELSDL